MKTLKMIARKWRDDESGGTTIEFLLWIPIMVMFLTLTTDATLLMHQQQNLYNAARDASRQVALGQKTEDEAATLFKTRFKTSKLSVDVAQADGFVTTVATVPFSEYATISGLLGNGTLTAQVSMWVENNES